MYRLLDFFLRLVKVAHGIFFLFYLNLFSLANRKGTNTHLRRAIKLKKKKQKKKFFIRKKKNKIVLIIIKICNKIVNQNNNIRKE